MKYTLFFLMAIFILSCSPAPQDDDGKLDVVVGIPPLEYFVEQITDELVDIHLLIKPGQNPHTYEPFPKQIMEVSRADLFLRMDMPFENVILEKLESKDELQVVDVTEGIEKKDFERHDHEEHDHEEIKDPHVWLSPPLIKQIAQNIAPALSKADSEHKDQYQKNLQSFLDEIEEVHEQIKERLQPYAGENFYVYHPAFGYFGEAYGLEQVYLEMEGKSFTPKQLKAFIDKVKQENVRILFVQPQFDTKSAKAIAQAIDGAVVSIDPLRKDVLTNLQEIAKQIEHSLQR